MKHLNTYKFIHNFEDSFEVTMTTHAQTADELVQEFVSFLLGCQFSEVSIKESLEGVASEIYVDKNAFR